MEVTNRFKGLDLTDRVPEELWSEVRNIVQEAVIKTIPKKKKFKEAKWLFEEALKQLRKEEKQKAKEKKIYPSKCSIPKKSKERQESLSK